MTEFGKSQLLTAGQLSDIGYNMVIYPVTTLRLAMYAVEVGLREIADTGTQSGHWNECSTAAGSMNYFDTPTTTNSIPISTTSPSKE
jgi:2-methylisocitrate lyase-like PEP mutase family enzyme